MQSRGVTKQTENPSIAFIKSNGLTGKQLKTNQWFYKYFLIFHSNSPSMTRVQATYLPIFPWAYLRTSMRKQMNQTLIIPIKGDEGVNHLVTTLSLALHKLQSSSIVIIFSDISQALCEMGIITITTLREKLRLRILGLAHGYYDSCSTSHSTSLHFTVFKTIL